MNVSVKDGSNYFRGLLVLIARDRRISPEEAELMHHVGKSLGFEKNFYENAINEILENKFIAASPPVFPSKLLARCFVKDGLKLAAADNDIHPFEEDFLRAAVELNGLDPEWFLHEKEKVILGTNRDSHLEVDNMVII
jgi:hypothetical protein